jgi:hypothetical protein
MNGPQGSQPAQNVLRDHLARISGSLPGQTLAIFFGIWAGVLAEDHADDILRAIDLRRGSDLWHGDPLWGAVGFYVFVLLTILLTVGGQRAQSRVRQDEESRRIAAENRLTTQSDLLITQTSRLEESSTDLKKQTDQLAADSGLLVEQTTALGTQSQALLSSSRDLMERSDRLIRQTRELSEQTDTLRDLVQTLPPKTILTTYVKTVQTCRRTYVNAYDVEPTAADAVEKLRAAVRTVLGAITDLFQVYENAPPNSVIAANIMLFSPASALRKLSLEKQQEIERTLTFATPGTTLRSLDGVLFTMEELSTRTDLEDDGRDPSLAGIRLPVPAERKAFAGGKELWRVLPGAPLAWALGEAVAYPSQEALLRWCEENGVYHQQVHQALRRYLEVHGNAIRSFVSLPLVRPVQGGQESVEAAAQSLPIGVLNVHSNYPGLLEDRKPDENLFILLHPILDFVVDLLSLLSAAEKAGRDTGGLTEQG